MWKVLDGPIGTHFLEAMSAVGLVGIGYFDGGARNFYAAKPLKRVSDLKGLKIRVQSSPIMVDMVKLLHATGAPIAYAEIYSALQTGVVDGAENNVPSWVSQNHYKIAKYMVKDEHLRLPEILICSKKFYDSLTEVQKVAIREAAPGSDGVPDQGLERVRGQVPCPGESPWLRHYRGRYPGVPGRPGAAL